MPQNFTATLHFDGQKAHAIIVPQSRSDGMYFEVNVPAFPRFQMKWSELERYDIVAEEGLKVPYALVLAASDAIEGKFRRKR